MRELPGDFAGHVDPGAIDVDGHPRIADVTRPAGSEMLVVCKPNGFRRICTGDEARRIALGWTSFLRWLRGADPDELPESDLIGAGGLGLLLHQRLAALDYGAVTTTLLAMIVLTLIVDFTSATIRRSLR